MFKKIFPYHVVREAYMSHVEYQNLYVNKTLKIKNGHREYIDKIKNFIRFSVEEILKQ